MKNICNTIWILSSKKNGPLLKALLENRPSSEYALLDALEGATAQDLTENDVIEIARDRRIRAERIASGLEINKDELAQRLAELEAEKIGKIKIIVGPHQMASSTAATTIISYRDSVRLSKWPQLAEQLLIHCQNNYMASDYYTDLGTAGKDLDCNYEFSRRLPKQKLDKIAGLAKAFFTCHNYDSHSPPNHSIGPHTAENNGGSINGSMKKEKGDR